MWPKYVDMTDNECKVTLRKLELEAYSNMVSALRAQGPLTDEKQGLLVDIAAELHIPRERYSAEIRRAVNDEKLSTIALQIYGPNTEIKWAIEGRREIPLIPRLHAQTAYSFLADRIANITATENADLPFPTKANRKQVVEVKTSEVKTSEVKTSEVKTSEVKTSEVKTSKQPETHEGLSTKNSRSCNVVVKNGKAVISVKPVSSAISTKPTQVISAVKSTKPTQVISAVKPTKPTQVTSAGKPVISTADMKMVSVSSSNPTSTLKIVNKNTGSALLSNVPQTSHVTGIKVMTPRSAATSNLQRPTSSFGMESTSYIRPNLSTVRPNSTNYVTGVKHNVVVMQKNSQIKRGVPVSSKDLVNKVLKRKPISTASPLTTPSKSKIPRLTQEVSQNIPSSSHENIVVLDISQGNSSSPLTELNVNTTETTPVTNGTNLGSHIKTYAKPKFILPSDITKPIVNTSSIASTRINSSSTISESRKFQSKPSVSATSSSFSEVKRSPSVNRLAKSTKPKSAPLTSTAAPVVSMILTGPASTSSFSTASALSSSGNASVPVMSSTKIIFTDNEGKVLGSMPSSSLAGSQSPLNLLFAMTSTVGTSAVTSTVAAAKSTMAPSNFSVLSSSNETPSLGKNVVVSMTNKPVSSNISYFDSSRVPGKTTMFTSLGKTDSYSIVSSSSGKLISTTSAFDKSVAAPRIQTSEQNFVLESEPIIVNVPSVSHIDSSSSSFITHCDTSALSEVNEVLVSLNETEIEDVGILDPVTGIYTFPFDENESNQDSTTSVNSPPSHSDLIDQLECSLNSQVLSVSSDPTESQSFSHIIVEPSTTQAEIIQTDLNESYISNGTTGTSDDGDISNVSITEVTVEESLECFETTPHDMFNVETVPDEIQNVDFASRS